MSFSQLVSFAHVFGQTYALPVPLWLFLFGAGTTVVVSFIAIGLFADSTPCNENTSGKVRRFDALTNTGRFLGVLLLALTVVTGLAGTQKSLMNFSVTGFWVLFLLGFTYLVAIFGNVWESVNPFKTLLGGIEGLIGRKSPPRHYPRRLSYWPALLAYFGLIWLELVGTGLGTTPFNLAVIILGYSAVTLGAAYWFGSEAWFTHGELFSVFFGLVAKVSPFAVKGNEVSIRRPLDGLIAAKGATLSLLLFIIFMLASTGFDGLKETVVFGELVKLLPDGIESHFLVTATLGLVLMPLILFGIYMFFVALMKRIVPTNLSVLTLACRFAFSLVPIAIAYHVAHYFTMVLITGQGAIPQLSDPFGSGLNLLGTADYKPAIDILSASVVWYVQVALIVLGHVAAVYVAHMEALRLFGNRRHALLSQIPMVALMVLYTAGSLWIIAQPIAV